MRKPKYPLDFALIQAGIKQVDLVRRMGVKSQLISSMKRGDIPNPDRWAEIAKILGVDVETIKSPTKACESKTAYHPDKQQTANDTAARIEHLEHQVQALQQKLTAIIADQETRPPFQAPIVPRREPQTIK